MKLLIILWLCWINMAWAVDKIPFSSTNCAPPVKHAAAPKKPILRIAPQPAEPIDPLLNQAYQAYLKGEFDLADRLYQQILKQDARNSDALLGLAAVAQHRGATQTAMNYYAQVLAFDPHNALANAGVSAFANNEERESQLKSWLHEQPDSASLYAALGNHYAAEARWSEAQQAYFNAYRLAPNDAEVAFNLAVSLEQLGQGKLAVPYYQRALQLDVGKHADINRTQLSQHIEALQR